MVWRLCTEGEANFAKFTRANFRYFFFNFLSSFDDWSESTVEWFERVNIRYGLGAIFSLLADANTENRLKKTLEGCPLEIPRIL